MQTGIASVTFRNLGYKEVISLTKQAKLDGIEWGGDIHCPPGDVKKAEEIGKATRDAGLGVISYGSYYHVGTFGDFDAVLESAAALQTKMIRVWAAGWQASKDATEEIWKNAVADSQRIADMAAAQGMSLSYEYHDNTLTDTLETTVRLLTEVNRANVFTYWQRPAGLTTEENLAAIKTLADMGKLTNLHVFSHEGNTRLPLHAKADDWARYTAATPAESALLFEFIKDDDPALFLRDASFMRALGVHASLEAAGFYVHWRNAGIPGGIPVASILEGEPIAPGADVTQTINQRIQQAGDAVQAAGGVSPDNLRVVQLTEGIFYVNPILLNRSGVVLRGMGEATIIRGHTIDNGAIEIGRSGWYNHTTTPAVNVTADVRVNDDRITVADASIFSPGMILKIDRLADDALAIDGGSEWPNGHNQFMRRANNSAFGPASAQGYRPIGQFIEIESIEGNTLILSNRINICFPLVGASGKELFPQVFNTHAHNYQFIGLEDVTLQMTAGSNDRGLWSWHLPAVNLRFASSYCWVKNITSDGTFFDANGRGFMGRHIEVNGFRHHITGNHVHHSTQVSPGGNGYGIRWQSTGSIICNNIADFLTKPIIGQSSNGGNVIAYNLVPNAVITVWNSGQYIDGATPGNPQAIDSWIETAVNISHGGYSHSDLFEGNFAANFHTDPTSGNGWYVLFRNHAFGQNMGGVGPEGDIFDPNHWTRGSTSGISMDGPQNAHATIGNVFLTPETGQGAMIWNRTINDTTRAVYRFNHAAPYTRAENGGHADGGRGFSYERFIWAHDFNYATNEILSRPSDAGWIHPPADLPDSLFLTEAPLYFEGYTWPPVNPFGTTSEERVGGLPALTRFNAWLAARI
jgi:sugar phosphate isomerase/epimerase